MTTTRRMPADAQAGADNYRALQQGQRTRMTVAVAIGADRPRCTPRIMPLPRRDEMMTSGFIRGKPVEM